MISHTNRLSHPPLHLKWSPTFIYWGELQSSKRWITGNDRILFTSSVIPWIDDQCADTWLVSTESGRFQQSGHSFQPTDEYNPRNHLPFANGDNTRLSLNRSVVTSDFSSRIATWTRYWSTEISIRENIDQQRRSSLFSVQIELVCEARFICERMLHGANEEVTRVLVDIWSSPEPTRGHEWPEARLLSDEIFLYRLRNPSEGEHGWNRLRLSGSTFEWMKWRWIWLVSWQVSHCLDEDFCLWWNVDNRTKGKHAGDLRRRRRK